MWILELCARAAWVLQETEVSDAYSSESYLKWCRNQLTELDERQVLLPNSFQVPSNLEILCFLKIHRPPPCAFRLWVVVKELSCCSLKLQKRCFGLRCQLRLCGLTTFKASHCCGRLHAYDRRTFSRLLARIDSEHTRAGDAERASDTRRHHIAGIETKQQIKQCGTGTGTDHIQEHIFVFTKFLGRQSK